MTEIVYMRQGDGAELCLAGHADYSAGHDPVCAALSILVHTLADALRAEEKAGRVEKLCLSLQKGRAEIRFTLTGKDRRSAEARMGVILRGFALLADSYPEYVCLKCEKSGGEIFSIIEYP